MNKYHKILELDKIINILQENLFLNASKTRFESYQLANEIEEINYMLDEVDEAVILTERMGRIFFHFQPQSDISYFLSKVHKQGVLSSLELAEINNFLETIKAIIEYKEKTDNAKIKNDFLSFRISLLYSDQKLSQEIKKIVTNYGEIKDDASFELKAIRKKQHDTETNIQNKLQEILHKTADKLSQQVISIRNERYVIPVKNDYKNQIKGIIHDQSSSGETVYIEPLIICQLNNELNQLKEQEKIEIEHILRIISQKIDIFYSELLSSYHELIELDIIFGKAKLAISMQAERPQINNIGLTELLNCHHPLLKVDKIIRNNILIGKNYRGIIITGPNTGGKTVLLKTVGLLSLMIKLGLLLPCDKNSNVAIYDNVFADIGDEQSIDQNLSTFSSHLKNVVFILENISPNSLVLLDELGSGTDPHEGSSLAISIFDYLISQKCNIIATSHYSELKMHAYSSDNIINASVEFNVQTLKPTYRLLIGVPGMSNALKIAKSLGLNNAIIEKAENYIFHKNDNLNIMLDKLIKQSNDLQEKMVAIEKEKQMLIQNNLLLKQEIDQTITERRKIIAETNDEKEKILNQTKKELEEILFDLNKLKSKQFLPHELSDLKYRIKQINEKQIVDENVINNKEIKIGDVVFLKFYHSHGKVLKKLKNEQYEIQVGNATIKAFNDEIELSEESKISKPIVKQQTVILNTTRHVSSKLDLRGIRYEDAVDKIDKFIDDAILGKLTTITFIHGFGSGIIRKLVQEKLKNNKAIAEFRYGGNGEGGQGATIATLK